MIIEDCNKICRICLKTPEELLPLFEVVNLAFKIKSISAIKVSPNDHLPKNVCAECIGNIDTSFNFRKTIVQNDWILRKYYAEINAKATRSDKNDCTDENLDFPNNDSEVETIADASKENNSDESKEIKLKQPTTNRTPKKDENKPRKPKRTCKVRLYKCDECDFNTMDYNKFRSHPINHKRCLCNICGKILSAANINKHVEIHSAPTVQCDECGKICKNSSALRSHMLLHKGVNRTCKICGRFYKERAAYTAHVATHRETKDLVHCSICNKKISRRCIKRHLRSHTGERPFICEYCKKGFSSPYALKTHKRQHTNEKPYKCDLCSMAFPQKVSLSTHLRSKHNLVDTSKDQQNNCNLANK